LKLQGGRGFSVSRHFGATRNSVEEPLQECGLNAFIASVAAFHVLLMRLWLLGVSHDDFSILGFSTERDKQTKSLIGRYNSVGMFFLQEYFG
jgi:hypothetical protein